MDIAKFSYNFSRRSTFPIKPVQAPTELQVYINMYSMYSLQILECSQRAEILVKYSKGARTKLFSKIYIWTQGDF